MTTQQRQERRNRISRKGLIVHFIKPYSPVNKLTINVILDRVKWEDQKKNLRRHYKRNAKYMVNSSRIWGLIIASLIFWKELSKLIDLLIIKIISNQEKWI